MMTFFLVLLLLILLFGGLGIFVAKAFLYALLIVLIVGLIGGAMGYRRV
jgi:hypothetical protein